ncbi:hypothetical protein TPHA_0E01110 [Tetrapisispora phaffii CBS 4417]|uniref:SWA2-like ubiquitin-associated domain-containing protein n=1 Tax=Tetrapisispora phaffii (strain ATCC 24235 / CBS 4417 / NBRC 1672 / NRRL Y-8282 / UCD 70-5) TaxID=1071381 RepID=G8BTH7_TETPH|nr:hypothetical protein TPHA_0E01110 [Tetrapisispora phaffii CBS 4417]CCE63205.1 hypothetical protein TPHA_0E01110 [Tetrapisispora phaffii CBS 4417]
MADPFADLLTSFKTGPNERENSGTAQSNTTSRNLSMNELLNSSSNVKNSNLDVLQPKAKNVDMLNKSTSVPSNVINNNKNLLDDFDDLFGPSKPSVTTNTFKGTDQGERDDLDDIMDMFDFTPSPSHCNQEVMPSKTNAEAQSSSKNEVIVDEVKDMEIAKLMSLGLSIDEAIKSFEHGILYDTVASRQQAAQRFSSSSNRRGTPIANSGTNNSSGGGLFSSIIGKSKQLIDDWTVNHDEDDRLFRNTDFSSSTHRGYSNSENSTSNSRNSTSNSRNSTSYSRNSMSNSLSNSISISDSIEHGITHKQKSPADLTSNELEGDLLDSFEENIVIGESFTNIPPRITERQKPNDERIQDNTLLDFGNEDLSSPANVSISSSGQECIPVISINQIELSGYNEFKDRGTEYFKKGDYVSATEQYEKSLNSLSKLHPLRIIASSNLLASLLKTGDYTSMITISTSALDLFPKESKLWDNVIQNSEPSKTYKEIWSKLVARRAEAFEFIENYQQAYDSYQLLIENNIFNEKIMAGKLRCQKVLNPETHNKPLKKLVATTAETKTSQTKNIVNTQSTSSGNLKKIQEQNKRTEKYEEEKEALYDVVEQKVNAWIAGKDDDIRHLLSRLQRIITWTQWNEVASSDLVMPKKVKITYLKAVAKTHPDKLPSNLDTESRMLAENIFSILSKNWEKFKVDNNIS